MIRSISDYMFVFSYHSEIDQLLIREEHNLTQLLNIYNTITNSIFFLRFQIHFFEYIGFNEVVLLLKDKTISDINC